MNRNPNYLATDAQKSYLKRLLQEAFAIGFVHRTGIDWHHMDRTTKEEAVKAITTLVEAKRRGWT